MLSEPCLDAHDLALLEARRAAHPASELAAFFFRFGSDQMLDAELPRNRAGDEAVGRGHDRSRIVAMTIHQIARLLSHDRDNPRAHVLPVPLIEHFARMTRQRL